MHGGSHAAADTYSGTTGRIRTNCRHSLENTREEIVTIEEWLVSKPNHGILGQTEFEVRDRVHKIGAKALEILRNERKKGDTKGPARTVRPVTAPVGFKIAVTKLMSACWARSCFRGGPTIIAPPGTRATCPATRPWGSRRPHSHRGPRKWQPWPEPSAVSPRR
jgi:hypothetical protein